MGSKRLRKLPDNEHCWYCGEKAEDVDHKLPLARGGRTCAENIVPACRKCNNCKGCKTVEEFRVFLKDRSLKKSTKHTVKMVAPHDFVFYGEREGVRQPPDKNTAGEQSTPDESNTSAALLPVAKLSPNCTKDEARP